MTGAATNVYAMVVTVVDMDKIAVQPLSCYSCSASNKCNPCTEAQDAKTHEVEECSEDQVRCGAVVYEQHGKFHNMSRGCFPRQECQSDDMPYLCQTIAEGNITKCETADISARKCDKSDGGARDKWVVNLSSRSLTEAEVSLLQRGLNYSVSSNKFPVKDIVASTETECKDIPGDKAAELRGRVVNAIKTTKPPTSNITKDERLALDKLKKDTAIIIVPVDKGRATCVNDATVYEEKANALLQDENVYEKLKKDLTQKYQTKLIKLLKDLKEKGAIDSRTYWKLYPTVCDVPKFYGLIKIQNAGADHHITNTQSFVENIRDLKLESDESLVSFDVSALFTSIPVDKTLEVVGELLRNDTSWKKVEAENLEPEQPKEKDSSSQNRDTETANKGFVTLPYIEGLSEKLRRAFRTAGVSTTFKSQNTLRSALVAPKDKAEPVKQSGIVYQLDCADCARKLEKRLSEHKSTAGSSKSAVRDHVVRSKGHQIDWENVKVLEKKQKEFSRRVLEAIQTRTQNPRLNRDQGLEIDPIWDN
ncbi:uncharacterized protein [Amphiura filiformis]|uniref:uncharacterized protein n=1 Tax=Amphiura filiformis TaxID=82378 RepID=UPI003B211444